MEDLLEGEKSSIILEMSRLEIAMQVAKLVFGGVALYLLWRIFLAIA